MCTQEDIDQVESKLDRFRNLHDEEKIKDYLENGGMFMNRADRLQFSTKEEVKEYFIDILPDRFLMIEGMNDIISQRCGEVEKNETKEKLKSLYKKLYAKEENLSQQDSPRKVCGAIDAIIHILTSVLFKRPSGDDFLNIAQDLIDEYEGKTLHDVIQEMKLSNMMPIGDPWRAIVGKFAKKLICEKRGINKEEFSTIHRKVKAPYGNIKVLKYHMNDLDVVRDCIRNVLKIPNSVGRKRDVSLREDGSRKKGKGS